MSTSTGHTHVYTNEAKETSADEHGHGSKYLQLNVGDDSMTIFERVHLLNGFTDERKMDNIRKLTYLTLLISAYVDPEEVVYAPLDLASWIQYLDSTENPLSLTEYSVFSEIEAVLNDIGVQINGSLEDLAMSRKLAAQKAKREDVAFSSLPMTDFFIKDRASAQHWIRLPEEIEAPMPASSTMPGPDLQGICNRLAREARESQVGHDEAEHDA